MHAYRRLNKTEAARREQLVCKYRKSKYSLILRNKDVNREGPGMSYLSVVIFNEFLAFCDY